MNWNLDELSCPLPEDIRRVIDYGDLQTANRLIERQLKDGTAPEVLKKRLRFEQRILRELPEVYPLTEEETLRLFRETVPDFKAEELQELRDDGVCDWIYLDGQVRYHEDCVDTALRTCSALTARRTDREQVATEADHVSRLSAMIHQMKADGGAHWRFRMRTTFCLEKEAEREGETLLIHMPLPVTDAQCTAGRVSTVPDGAVIAPENEPQRTASWQMLCSPGMEYVTDAEWEIRTRYVDPDPEKVSAVQPHFDTEEQLPQIRFTPFIRQLAAELAGDTQNPLVKARRFYDYVTTQCKYRYVPPYYFKTCIPEYFGTGRRGDCGMHALLFIALCRASGIPAKWQSGLYTPPWGPGMHDWAKFYVEPYGWLFADGSFGGSAYRAGDLERWNFYFGNLEPWRLVYDSALQQQFNPPKRHLRYDPYDSQSAEAEYEDGGLPRSLFRVERKLLVCESLPLH